MAIFNCYIHVIALKKTCLLYSLLNKQVFFKCIIPVLEGYTIKSEFFHRVENSMKAKILTLFLTYINSIAYKYNKH